MKAEYEYIDYPFVDKSGFITYIRCKYLYYRKYIDRITTEANIDMKKGTYLHSIYNEFYDRVNYDQLFKLDWESHPGMDENAVYQYFISLLYEMVALALPDKHIELNIQAFAMYQTMRFYYANFNNRGLRHKIHTSFFITPSNREVLDIYEPLKMYGKMDLIEEGENEINIQDYKTGDVPPKIVEGKYMDIETICKYLPNRYVREGNFYALLYLFTRKGYNVFKDLDGKWRFYKNGEISEKFGNLYYTFIFTGGIYNDRPTVFYCKKKYSIASMRSILSKIEEIQTNEEWEREPNYYTCGLSWKNGPCELYLSECKGVVPDEVFRNLRREPSPAEENVLESGGSEEQYS